MTNQLGIDIPRPASPSHFIIINRLPASLQKLSNTIMEEEQKMSSEKRRKKKKTYSNSVQAGTFESGIKRYAIPTLIFLSILFISLLINRPALYMNDEFIAVNQLHQLNSGHQTLINECKYGCYQNGTPSEYFIAKNNILGYTLFLPLLSLPALQFFSIFGDGFRLPIILGWSLIPLLISVIISMGFPDNSRIIKIPLIYIGAAVSMLILMINLYYYHPFPFTVIDAPVESGAIIFTNTILGALTGVIIYLISDLVWNNRRISLLCTLSILCCSSYLFWSGTAKDHIPMTFMLALVTYFFISSIITKNNIHRYAGFFSIGLLAFVRPETGLCIFIGSLIFLVCEQIIDGREIPVINTLKTMLLCIAATVCGTIPLFLNNYFTTKNLLIPPFYYYLSNTVPEGYESILSKIQINGKTGIIQNIPETLDISSFSHASGLIHDYFLTTSPVTITSSFLEILIHPESGNMSLFAVTPLFLAGVILFTWYWFYKRPELGKNDLKILLLFTIFIIFSTLAYGRSLPGISASQGIVPDMRYFLPLYFLGGFIGFYPLATWGKEAILQITNLKTLVILMAGTSIMTILIVLSMPGASYNEYTTLYMTLVYIVTLFFIISFISYSSGKISATWVGIFLLVMISLPLSWQLLMDIFYSTGKFHGYPFWMPYLEYLIEKYVVYQVIS